MKNALLSRFLLAAALPLALGASACAKNEKDETPAETTPTETAEVEQPAEKPAAEPAAEPDDAAEEYIHIEARHAPDKPDDPVLVKFPTFEVTEASFDPAKLEGGTAKLEISLGDLDSGVAKRDAHLRSADYLDAEKYPVVEVSVADVAKKEGDTYTANAEVTLHGVTQTMPVEFTVVDRGESSVTIEAEQPLTRGAFQVGKTEGDPTQDDLVLKMRLTVETSA